MGKHHNFFVISTIEDKEVYKQKFSDFNTDVKFFYAAGQTNFLTEHSTGDSEIFYLHCLCYYLPQIAHFF